MSLKIWVGDEAAVWLPATLDGGTATLADGSTRAADDQYQQNEVLMGEGAAGVPDMSVLAQLHEPAVLRNLELRHALGRVYTWCGAGMLTHGGQRGHPAPLASRLHRIPTHFLLNLHGI